MIYEQYGEETGLEKWSRRGATVVAIVLWTLIAVQAVHLVIYG